MPSLGLCGTVSVIAGTSLCSSFYISLQDLVSSKKQFLGHRGKWLGRGHFLHPVLSFGTAIPWARPCLTTRGHPCKLCSGNDVGIKCHRTELLLSACMGKALLLYLKDRDVRHDRVKEENARVKKKRAPTTPEMTKDS